jgi:hypothetical protein
MRAVLLPAGVGFVLSNPHWEYTRNKTTKTRTKIFEFWSSAAPKLGLLYLLLKPKMKIHTNDKILFF